MPQEESIKIYEDNQGCLALAQTERVNPRTKHIDVKHHFLRDLQEQVPALKTCIKCEASLCDIHCKTHNKSAEHVLIDPTASLEKRKCSVHKEIFKYYCTEDSACICVSCSLAGEHRGHLVETLDEASEKKKEKLRNVLQKLSTKREETEKRVQSLQERRREDQKKAAGVTERVTALFRDIRRQLRVLEKRVLSEISRQEGSISLSVSDLIQELEIKKDELSKKMHHIEELCDMSDPLTVLQEPDTGDLCDTEDRERLDDQVHGVGDLDVGLISETLYTGLSDITKGINVNSYIQRFTHILLDVNSVSKTHMLSKKESAPRLGTKVNPPPQITKITSIFSAAKLSSLEQSQFLQGERSKAPQLPTPPPQPPPIRTSKSFAERAQFSRLSKPPPQSQPYKNGIFSAAKQLPKGPSPPPETILSLNNRLLAAQPPK
ncbi:uncharacterized protein LOC142150902 [Mixophyes fleayi]|uniref:uncharacterized protein LOC142150902 n=1 Tax=Mixophyes fleayi TaxID=3061075 RepID=UPI003F4DFE8E